MEIKYFVKAKKSVAFGCALPSATRERKTTNTTSTGPDIKVGFSAQEPTVDYVHT
jgi:hypothetical protein